MDTRQMSLEEAEEGRRWFEEMLGRLRRADNPEPILDEMARKLRWPAHARHRLKSLWRNRGRRYRVVRPPPTTRTAEARKPSRPWAEVKAERKARRRDLPKCCARECERVAWPEEHIGYHPEGEVRPVGLRLCREHTMDWELQDENAGWMKIEGYEIPYDRIRGTDDWDEQSEARWLLEKRGAAVAIDFLMEELGRTEGLEAAEAWGIRI